MDYDISEQELFLFHQGTNYHSHKLLGCHPIEWEGTKGYRFVVWAPNAKEIHVVGDFNQWKEITRIKENNERRVMGWFLYGY